MQGNTTSPRVPLDLAPYLHRLTLGSGQGAEWARRDVQDLLVEIRAMRRDRNEIARYSAQQVQALEDAERVIAIVGPVVDAVIEEDAAELEAFDPDHTRHDIEALERARNVRRHAVDAYLIATATSILADQ